ncbi:MAG: hypothetical protein ACYC5M_10600 [Anaerolineae bacterium]
MKIRHYFSVRTGRHDDRGRIDLPMLRRLLVELFRGFEERDYFQEALGYFCVDSGDVAGTLGHDVGARVFLALRKEDLWPIQEKCPAYTESDCFDMIEFLHDHVSLPNKKTGYFHDFGGCGWHYRDFDKPAGQAEFREEANQILSDYGLGWELDREGAIRLLSEEGMASLLDAAVPTFEPANVEKRVADAIRKFRNRGSTPQDRRDAVRDLGDVLEYLRPRAKECFLTAKDDDALFTIANEFAIRHHNGRQKGDYDIAIWYSWMFYVYLATIHAAVRAIREAEAPT